MINDSIKDRLEEILKVICDYFGFTIKQIKSDSRNYELMFARIIFAYIVKIDLGYPYRFIYTCLNRKEHSSAFNLVSRYNDLNNTNSGFRFSYKDIVNILKKKELL